MGYRLSKIYTRTGDEGTTGLGDGQRIAKDGERVEAFGTVDELSCLLGIVQSYTETPEAIQTSLNRIQHELFELGGELCLPGYEGLEEKHIDALEQDLDSLNEILAPLKDFILPGGHPAAAQCQLARTVCRRSERRVITLSQQEQVSTLVLKYLNRLSDLLFVMARYINKQQGITEPLWQHER